MSNILVTPRTPSPLVELLERAGVDKSSVIRVTGPSALGALLWLCRHEYAQVGLIRSGGGGPHEEAADAVLVAHTCGELELKLFLPVARMVRSGGVFIFRVRTAPGASAMGVEWMLQKAGLVVERRIEKGGRALVLARRRAMAAGKAA